MIWWRDGTKTGVSLSGATANNKSRSNLSEWGLKVTNGRVCRCFETFNKRIYSPSSNFKDGFAVSSIAEYATAFRLPEFWAGITGGCGTLVDLDVTMRHYIGIYTYYWLSPCWDQIWDPAGKGNSSWVFQATLDMFPEMGPSKIGRDIYWLYYSQNTSRCTRQTWSKWRCNLHKTLVRMI